MIGFGHVEGRLPGQRVLDSVMWVVRLRDDLISSIEVFQAAGGPSLSSSRIERFQDDAPTPATRLSRSGNSYLLVSSAPERRDGDR